MGTSVTVAATALLAAREHGEAILIDVNGDQAAILGLPSPQSAGVFDWLHSRADSRESFERLAIPTSVGLHLVPPGSVGPCDPDRVAQLTTLLTSFDCPVVIDCGLRVPSGGTALDDGDPAAGFRSTQAASGQSADRPSSSVTHSALVEELCSSSRSILVSSSCYLAVRRAVQVIDAAHDGDGLVVIADPGRALDANDIASVTQLKLVASAERDPAVARCVDAGMFLHRPPRGLLRAMRDLL